MFTATKAYLQATTRTAVVALDSNFDPEVAPAQQLFRPRNLTYQVTIFVFCFDVETD